MNAPLWAGVVFAAAVTLISLAIVGWHKGSEAIDRALAELDLNDRDGNES